MELTIEQQIDYLEEEGRERYFEERDEQNGFNDFFSENKGDLRQEFCEDFPDEFNKFCKEQFERWKADKE